MLTLAVAVPPDAVVGPDVPTRSALIDRSEPGKVEPGHA
jgi:hypothetical protein